ncbi:unnamed protein product [Adineta steineri]|uniref:Dipeptidyl aminopeptidase-like protein 6 n=1 Tax=Adineta steineri TaxID=433720 RepID=A0A815AMJ7_9BILA|nr:unnamed protein product [Adineta steineri]CAF1261654.1 unnamed protein product [Adineta steineri]
MDEDVAKSSAYAEQELVGGSSKKQNWKGLSIAFIVIAFVCSLILGAIVLTNKQEIPYRKPYLTITEQDIFKIKPPKPWNGTWISDKYFSYLNTNNSIWIYNCDTLTNKLLFKTDFIQQEYIDHGIVSPLTRYILVPIKKEKIRPYYTEYQYDIYEKTKLIASIISTDNQKLAVSTVVYSHSDNLFAFTHNFDIYIYNITRKTSYRITSDGNQNTIHNGLVEWIYEYEIFNRNNLLFWSPTDRYLAFIKINLTNVPKNYYLKYDFISENDDLYSVPYPKYNDPIPLLDVYIFNTRSKKTIRVPRPIEYEKLKISDIYIYHIVWYHDTYFSIVYGNRIRNSSVIQLYEIVADKIILKSKFIEETGKGYLLARFLKPYFSSNGTYAYIIRFDLLNSDKSSIQKSFPRVVRIHFNQSYPQINAKSSEDINADEIIHVDNFNRVYFTGSYQNDTLEKQLYRWTYTDNNTDIECLSCNDSCGYANAQFSLGKGSYHILECFGPSIPYSTLYNQTDKLVLINDNEPFREWTTERLMPYIDYFSVPLDDKNTVGNGMIILPPNYTPNKTIASYPVIVTINNRLYDQRVNKKYILPLADFIQVIQDNISIVLFDAHGSTGQDESYMKSNFQNWFERQHEDYLKVAQHLKWNDKKFSETLNNTRFGLRAQGPAAIIALKLLEENNKNKDEYICAFLQSPVYDLSYYYATFSEQINGINMDFKSSHRFNIQNKSLAIVHGTADEIVHFKHSATLAKSFTDTDMNFDFKVYPDASHYFEEDPIIYNDFLHYQRQFFQKCLGGRTNKERKITIPEEHE